MFGLCLLTLASPRQGSYISQEKEILLPSVIRNSYILDSKQPGNSEPSPMTNLPVYFINSELLGVSEQFCDDQKVLNHQNMTVVEFTIQSFFDSCVLTRFLTTLTCQIIV